MNTWLPIYVQVEGGHWGGVAWGGRIIWPSPRMGSFPSNWTGQSIYVWSNSGNTKQTPFAAEYHGTNWISNCFRRISRERQNPEQGLLMGNACLQFSRNYSEGLRWNVCPFSLVNCDHKDWSCISYFSWSSGHCGSSLRMCVGTGLVSILMEGNIFGLAF